ncbi:MAG: threonine synthase [Candidatus Methylomirabilia bacterium]
MTHLECTRCGSKHPTDRLINLCDCGGILYPRYDVAALRSTFGRDEVKDGPNSIWRYRRILPLQDESDIVSAGEGYTPVLRAERRGPFTSFPHLWIKDESSNPTGTFKARGMSACLSMARKLGARVVALPSAGNAGAAAAAYAARAGMPCHVFMPRDTPFINIGEALSYGARVSLIDGLITECGKRVAEGVKTHGWFDISTLKEPYRIEGKKTMGYEVAEQFHWELPDWILYPTGGGTGLVGMWKAFEEMEALGWIGIRRPRMVSVQAAGCQPIVQAFHEGALESRLWENATTAARGLRVPKAYGDYLILQVLRESRGTALAVTEEEWATALRELAEQQGILACPEGAACWAALKKLASTGTVKPAERIVLFNTGTGLKNAEILPRETSRSDPAEPAV